MKNEETLLARFTPGFRQVILWLLIISVAYLLITPAIDFPDAVMSKGSTSVSSLAQVNAGFVSAIGASPIAAGHLVRLMSSGVIHGTATSLQAGMPLVLNQICILRC